MRKKLFTLVLSLLAALALHAVPAKRTLRTVHQPDGTPLTLVLRGDEHVHFLCTPDGTPVVRSESGLYCYASLSAGGFASTGRTARNTNERSSEEAAFALACRPTDEALTTLYKQCVRKRTAAVSNTLSTRSAQASSCPDGQKPLNISGRQRGLVILVDFQDVKFTLPDIRATIDRQMNEAGYNDNGNSGSVHDYFLAQSYGQFDLSFDVVGPVTVSHDEAYYGAPSGRLSDVAPERMVYEAVKLAHEQQSGLDFSQYDWNNDGEAELVFIVYAGYGQAQGAPAETIWPHQWKLSEAGLSLSVDGVKFDNYACSCELMGSGLDGEPPVLDGIGTACHEFSHCFGLPDMYHTGSRTDIFGMDMWSILDYGCYADGGFQPVGYTAYERWSCGWLTPTELNAAATVERMPALANQPVAYIIHNERVPTEYYLLENRQAVGTDSELPGHGLLVTHVDYDASAWSLNLVNYTKQHQRCTIIPADNALNGAHHDDGTLTYTDDLAGDPYPGTSGNTQLTDQSRPAASLYNINADDSKCMGKPITQIAETADGLISFDFMGGGEVINGLHEATAQGADKIVSIYTTDGRFVGTGNDAQAALGKHLPTGVYLIRTADGATVKTVTRSNE